MNIDFLMMCKNLLSGVTLRYRHVYLTLQGRLIDNDRREFHLDIAISHLVVHTKQEMHHEQGENCIE